MKCIKCNTGMVIGQAISPHNREIRWCFGSQPPIKIDTLELIDCWKCPKCGQSDYIEKDNSNGL
jgi:ssDNA-binding Zn-finger/Zn-ribbon topoisomerase 1